MDEVLQRMRITNVTSVNRLLVSNIGVSTYRQNRPGWAIALKLQGRSVYTVGHTDILSDCLHPVLIPKGSTYSWKCEEAGKCVMIEFDADSEGEMLYSFEVGDTALLTKCVSKIEKGLASADAAAKLECFHALYEILLLLAKSEFKDEHLQNKHEILKPAMDYLSNCYYDSAITNDYLAGLCHMSTVYFRKLFEKTYGMSPIKYLNTLRIDKAKSILNSDFESIEQVAFSVGYNSIYHFSKMFKTYTAMSPSQYRLQRNGLFTK